MILPFSKQLNGKPTYFVERIWEGLLRNHFQDDKEYVQFMNDHEERFNTNWDWFPDEHERLSNPKLHTIRTDEKDRWKPGILIDYFINCRKPNMFRFAPRIPVVSVQEIEIKHHLDYISIFIDKIIYEIEVCEFSKEIKSTDPVIEQLAQNDGFDTIEAFFEYFNEDYVGKIIHWTDMRY